MLGVAKSTNPKNAFRRYGRGIVDRILMADDQMEVLESLRLLLKSEGFAIEAVTSPKTVLDAIGDLFISNSPAADRHDRAGDRAMGLAGLRQILQEDRSTPINYRVNYRARLV
jgi:DNA-binding response OmpR family regulator